MSCKLILAIMMIANLLLSAQGSFAGDFVFSKQAVSRDPFSPKPVFNHFHKTPFTSKMRGKRRYFQGSAAINGHLLSLHTRLLQINYAKASDIAIMIQEKNTELLSERGTLRVDKRTNAIWIQDTAPNLDKITGIIKQLDAPVKQVLIEARIVDATQEFTRDLGVSWGVSNADSERPVNHRGHSANANSLADKLHMDLASTAIIGNVAPFGVALATLGDGILLDLELAAMESEGRGEVISRPRLLTMNQQPATIESGEEIPYQESTRSGATAVSFKKAVLSLKVTPQITADGNIMMELQINQDRPSGLKYNGVPAIYTKEIKTAVFVANGRTIVLGGIYKQEKDYSINRVPLLGVLPIVGNLFKRKSTTNRNEELLIFITPRIITNHQDEEVFNQK